MARVKHGRRAITLYVSQESFRILECLLSKENRPKGLTRCKATWCERRIEAALRSLAKKRGGK
jgi:hypothetical protein